MAFLGPKAKAALPWIGSVIVLVVAGQYGYSKGWLTTSPPPVVPMQVTQAPPPGAAGVTHNGDSDAASSALTRAGNAVATATQAAGAATPVRAQDPQPPAAPQVQPTDTSGASGMKICSGPAGGAFERVVSDITKACSLELGVKATTGAGDNLTAIHNGQCQFGIVNSDDVWGRIESGSDPKVKETRAILGLFEGVVHMLAIKPELQKFSQLRGQRIGLTGGAVATWDGVIERNFPDLAVSKEVFASTVSMSKALREGRIDAAVMVGAKPQPWISANLAIAGIHLVEFDRTDKLKSLMTRVEGGKTVGFLALRPVGGSDYAILSGAPVMQLTTRSILATSVETDSSPAGNSMTKKVFACVQANINRFRETGHESWRTVSTMNDRGGVPSARIR